VTVRAAGVVLDLDAIPLPPFLGFRVVDDIPLTAVYPYLNARTLFTGHWGFRRGERKSAEFQAFLQAEAAPLLAHLKDFLIDHPQILQPRVIYGYTHCQSQGNTLRVYHPETGDLLHTFQFPRGGAQQLCLADYFAPVASGVMDVIAWQIVGLGPNAAPWEQQLLAEGRYRDYYLTHGLFVEMAEALAEYWHAMVRFELDIHHDDSPDMENILAMEGGYQGCRYSFGYPACPDMRDQEKLFAMLAPERLGITLTRNWMQNPEASTSALIVHHLQAYYFDVRQQAAGPSS
jgi:5-methyltetrahydrofolate--homocysteine methyltransferase